MWRGPLSTLHGIALDILILKILKLTSLNSLTKTWSVPELQFQHKLDALSALSVRAHRTKFNTSSQYSRC